MSLRKELTGAEAINNPEEEKTAPLRWSPSSDPFCVDDVKFDIKKLHQRYADFHSDIASFDDKKTIEHKITENQRKFQETIAKLKKSRTILGHVFTKFRLLYNLQEQVTYNKDPSARYTLIDERNIACIAAVTYLQARIQDDINEIKSTFNSLKENKLASANKAIANLEAQHRQLSHPYDLREAAVGYAKSIYETETQRFKKTALKIIERYKKSLSPFNFYGRKRAEELEDILHLPETVKTKDTVKTVIANFIKEGKTHSDYKTINFFRSASRSSGIDDMSLRGMLIAEFMPRAYYRDVPHNLRIVKIRQLITADTYEIVNKLVAPEPEQIVHTKQKTPSSATNLSEAQAIEKAIKESLRETRLKEKEEFQPPSVSLTR
jgi:hypothetical protein